MVDRLRLFPDYPSFARVAYLALDFSVFISFFLLLMLLTRLDSLIWTFLVFLFS